MRAMLDGTAASADLVATVARQHTARCIDRLAEIPDGHDLSAAVRAAEVLLNRGFGLPVQQVVFDAGGIAISVAAGSGAEKPHHRTNGEATAWNAC
jgi:hypothetical protein